jgi:SH3 domain-containing YSC84-like protein 1
MKRFLLIFVCLVMTSQAAFSALSKDEVKRLEEAATIIGDLRDAPDKGIPQELWKKAECVVVIPSMKKAAFVVGGEYGSGVMSCRNAGDWSAPVFMQLAKGSWGLQIGAAQTDLVLLVMNRKGIDKLLQDKVTLGADASVAGGPVGRTATAATDAQMKAEMLSYSRTQGLFAGIDLAGGVLKPDKDADRRAYGPTASAREIINGTAATKGLPAASAFLKALARDVPASNALR